MPPNTDNMSFYHYTPGDRILRILASGEIWATDGSFGYGVYGLDTVPSKNRRELAGRAFGGMVEHKFGFAIKVRMPKPDNDERMTRHLTQDDHAIHTGRGSGPGVGPNEPRADTVESQASACRAAKLRICCERVNRGSSKELLQKRPCASL